jgi:hypothetical protein
MEDEVRSWSQAGIAVLVSLLEEEEIEELELGGEPGLTTNAGIEFVAFPIKDREVPDSRIGTKKLLRKLEGHLANGQRVAVHLSGGDRPVRDDRGSIAGPVRYGRRHRIQGGCSRERMPRTRYERTAGVGCTVCSRCRRSNSLSASSDHDDYGGGSCESSSGQLR